MSKKVAVVKGLICEGTEESEGEEKWRSWPSLFIMLAVLQKHSVLAGDFEA